MASVRALAWILAPLIDLKCKKKMKTCIVTKQIENEKDKESLRWADSGFLRDWHFSGPEISSDFFFIFSSQDVCSPGGLFCSEDITAEPGVFASFSTQTNFLWVFSQRLCMITRKLPWPTSKAAVTGNRTACRKTVLETESSLFSSFVALSWLRI